MPLVQCPVLGCGSWSSSWGKKSYRLPSPDVFTLQLDSTIDVSINNRICQPCWERDKNHTMKLDGRTRVHPIPSPSPLEALLSAVSIPLPQPPVPLPSPPFTDSLPSATPTLARVITVFPTHPLVSSSPSTVQSQSDQSPTLITTPRRTHSSPPVLDLSPAPSTFSERQRDVVASVMAGIDYERYRLQEVMKGGTPVSKDTWYAHQSTVYNSIIQIAESREVEYLKMLRATGQRLVFCADAAWSHRGYEANQCCWLLLNAENKQIALAVVLTKSRWEKGEEVHKGNYKGSSGGMEGMAMERGIARLKGWLVAAGAGMGVRQGLICQRATEDQPRHHSHSYPLRPWPHQEELPEVADGHLRHRCAVQRISRAWRLEDAHKSMGSKVIRVGGSE